MLSYSKYMDVFGGAVFIVARGLSLAAVGAAS